MTFNNSKTIIGMRIRLFAVTVLVLVYMVLAYVAGIIKFPFLGMTDNILTPVIIGIYVLYAIYPMILNYQYISYSDEEDKLEFRYFTSGIIGGKKNAIAVKKSDFAGYRREKRLFGLIQSITIYHQLPQGVAKYPPVYISILNSKEKAAILDSLYRHTPSDATAVKE
jgi:hypothetical protein